MHRLAAPLLLTLTLTALTNPAAAEPPKARALLGQAIAAFGQGRHEEASDLLSRAQIATSDPNELALVHRQRGIVFAAREMRLDAARAFLRALYFDSDLALPNTGHHHETERLFACAKALDERRVTEPELEARYRHDFVGSDWHCPDVTPPPPVAATPAPAPSEPAITTAAPHAASDEDDDSILSSPWLWVAVGAVAAGAAAVAVVSLSHEEELHGGTTDITLRVP